MKKRLTKEQIIEKDNALSEQFKKSIEEQKDGRSSPAQEFLNEISERIKEATDGGLSATQISRDIKKVFGITISATTVRGYIKNKLGIDLKKKKQKSVSPIAKTEEKEKSSVLVGKDESVIGDDNKRIKTKVNDI